MNERDDSCFDEHDVHKMPMHWFELLLLCFMRLQNHNANRKSKYN